MVTKACTVCGAPTGSPKLTRCDAHRIPGRSYALKQAAAQVVRNATHCAICGEQPSLNNPLQADHIEARALGGKDTFDNLRALCRRCNARRGAAITNRGRLDP